MKAWPERSERVGFIGLGTMGGKMAANLQKAGYDLVVHDIRREAASSQLAAGATWADSPTAVGQASDMPPRASCLIATK